MEPVTPSLVFLLQMAMIKWTCQFTWIDHIEYMCHYQPSLVILLRPLPQVGWDVRGNQYRNKRDPTGGLLLP